MAEKIMVGSEVMHGSGLRRGFVNSENAAGYVYVNGSVVQAFDFVPLGKFSAQLSMPNSFNRNYQLSAARR